jgi:hypothetical protein
MGRSLNGLMSRAETSGIERWSRGAAGPVVRSCRKRIALVVEIPHRMGDFEFPIQRSNRIRMMRGIGIPISQSRMGM